jgi:hypothetical protein
MRGLVAETLNRPEPRHVVAFVAAHGDPALYLRENPDVEQSGQRPITHWLRHGLDEGRRFPGIRLRETLGELHQLDENASARVPYGERSLILEVDGSLELERELERWASRYGDPVAYLVDNPDVAATGVEPLRHWLASGIAEGRALPGVEVRLRPKGPNLGWEWLAWRGEPVVVRAQRRPCEWLVEQIAMQSSHEPALNSPKPGGLSRLRWLDATRIFDRDGVDAVAAARALLAEPTLGPVQTLEVYDQLVAKIETVLEHRRMLVAVRTLALHHVQNQIAKLPTVVRDELGTTGKIETRLRRLTKFEDSNTLNTAGR